jgi:uncharacterized protein (TIGR04255 family)
MDRSIPKRLRREPLLEALWEMRFTSENASIAEILPGLLYRELSPKYSQLERLPEANIPRELADVDPNLRFRPIVRLVAAPFSVQVGAHMISVSCVRPYAGWPEFSARILEVANALGKTDLATHPERFSLKYVDLLQLDTPPTLACLNLQLMVSGRDLERQPVHLRTEIRDITLVHVLQIAAPVQARIGKEAAATGVMIDLDTVSLRDEMSFWSDLEARLNAAHDASKKLFFDLLTENTLQKLEPEY